MASNAETGPRPQDERPPSIVYGPMCPVPLTMTFSELIEHHVEIRGDQPAVISHPQDLVVSFKQLNDRSIRLAKALAKDGVGKGDLIAICLGSRIEYFETFFACARLGAALVMLNYASGESEMVALLKIVCESYRNCPRRNIALMKFRSKDHGLIAWVHFLRLYQIMAQSRFRSAIDQTIRHDRGHWT